MVILDRNSNIRKQGATEIVRVYDDFSAIPSWLTITGNTSVNSADSLTVSRGATDIEIKTREYNVTDYDALFIQFGSFRKGQQNTIESLFFRSNDGLYEVEFKSLSATLNSKIGCFHNSTLLEEVKGTMVWNNPNVVNKPCTYSINYNVNLSLFTLLSNGAIMAEVKVPPVELDKQYSLGFVTTAVDIVLAQIVHKTWKSL